MDSGASLHMMSKTEVTFGEKDTIRRSKEPTVITTVSGKAESTDDATVYVNDLDLFWHNGAFGRVTSSAVFGLIVRRKTLVHGKGRVSIREKRWKKQVQV